MFAVMPLEVCAIYGHKWPAPFLLGASMPRVFINAKILRILRKKLIWDPKNEMQCVPGTHKIDRTLRCKIKF